MKTATIVRFRKEFTISEFVTFKVSLFNGFFKHMTADMLSLEFIQVMLVTVV